MECYETLCYAMRNWNKRLNDIVCNGMILLRYSMKFETHFCVQKGSKCFEVNHLKKTSFLLICDFNFKFFLIKITTKTRLIFYRMLCYAMTNVNQMTCYDVRFQCYVKRFNCYAMMYVCCKRYACMNWLYLFYLTNNTHFKPVSWSIA